MSELISGKEAAIAYLDGKEVLHVHHDFTDSYKWSDCKGMRIDDFKDDKWAFKIKPRTITINGVEVPAPFNPKEGEDCCYLSDESVGGFHTISYNSARYTGMAFGLYRPSDVEEVVAALRSVFNVK